MPMITRVLVLIALLLCSSLVSGYNGPGSGVSFLGALWSLFAGFFIVLSAILFWPVRAMLRRRRERARAAAEVSRG